MRKITFLSLERPQNLLSAELKSAGWEVQAYTALNPSDIEVLSNSWHDIDIGLVSLDKAHDADWRQALETLLQNTRHCLWIGLLSSGSVEKAPVRSLIADYLYDYHIFPAHLQRLLCTLGHAHGMAALYRPPSGTQSSCSSNDGPIIGKSPAIREVKRAIRKIADADAHVTITGESGTGKELVARKIHQLSNRASRPFVAVNCGAIPQSLIHMELFGYEKGAFTGAAQRKIGRIEAANGGFIFLDEIGDLPVELQLSLLRFIEEKTVERIGSTTAVPMDLRIVAATNVELEKALLENRFREELYYRINVLRLHLPPLRERKEDIDILAEHFLLQAVNEVNSAAKGFSRPALKAMKAYRWPGNIRELYNRVFRAVVMANDRLIRPDDLGLAKPAGEAELTTLWQTRSKAEKEAIEHCMTVTNQNVSQTARLLDVSRTTLYRMMHKHRLF